MGFYGELPDSFNLVANSNNTLIKEILKDKEERVTGKLSGIKDEINNIEADKKQLEKSHESLKYDEIPQAEKDKLNELRDQIKKLNDQKDDILAEYAKGNKLVKQLIDLALQSNNMLKGEDITRFVKRSVDLIQK